MSATLAIASALIVGPTFGLFQEHREKLELQKCGVWTKAILISKVFRNDRSGKKWTAKYQYTVNQTIYQTNYHDKKDQFTGRDTIEIIYSKEFPKIYALDYEWEK